MKLKFIKDSERVINTIDFDIIHTTYRNHNDLFEDVMVGRAFYSIRSISSKGVAVYIDNNKSAFPIKVFNSDDPEYNRRSAENLFELLKSNPNLLDQKE